MDTDCSSELESSENSDSSDCDENDIMETKPPNDYNVVKKIFNRQLYGRFAQHSKAKTDKIFNSIPDRCCFNFSDVVPFSEDTIHQIFMGFSQCGRFLLSYSVEHSINVDGFFFSHRYILHVWSFIPGRQAKLVAEHRIFRHFKNQDDDMDVTMCQWPTDLEKLVIYGTCQSYQSEAYLTIVTLPSMQRCKDCTAESSLKNEDTFAPLTTSQCLKHGVTVDAMLSIMPPYPKFKPNISLAYPDHVILNTGHYLYALNISLDNNSLFENNHTFKIHKTTSLSSLVGSEVTSFPDNVSDISESVSIKQELEFQNQNGDIVSDVSDCETEYSEYSKPFHELNISCEPLNVTGRSYWTSASVTEPSTTKPRVKMFLHKKELTTNNEKKTNQEKSKIDIKIAEKAYEFTEETEKCEKLSLFRKKRLADKKYEFSEDNCENIVPFNLIRHERRFCGKGQTSKSLIRNTNNASPDSGQFLSPRNSTGIHSPRSPMLSPNSRSGPFSPSSSSRSVYNRLVSPSSTNRKSPLSPRGEISQKYNIYSPSHIDSDYSDNDSKLILRQINNISSPKVTEMSSDNLVKRESSLDRLACSGSSSSSIGNSSEGLLIVDEKAKVVSSKESYQWIKEVVRRYSAVDFESASSLVSDGQRDDYISIELPVLVHTTSSGEEHHLDVVPSHMSDEMIGPGITIIHRTFDAEQFCHRTAKRICREHNLKFTFCADYDINIINICPLTGDVICSAYIEVGAVGIGKPIAVSRIYCLRLIFVWGAGRPGGGHCMILDSETILELRPLFAKPETPVKTLYKEIEQCNFRKMRVMVHNSDRSLTHLQDEDNFVSIVFDAEDLDEYYFI